MSGIAGFFNRSADANLLQTMIGSIRHRGPAHIGTYCQSPVGLAHASALEPVGPEAGQPIPNEDGTLWLLCDGVIYADQPLRHRLRAAGHHFQTDLSVEVILHLYEEEGAEGFSRLNGQFAAVFWDTRRQSLLVCRDRLGICPLYYTFVDGAFYFASEIKALLAIPNLQPEPDLLALQAIWTFWTSPTRTVLRGVHEFPAAHFALLHAGQRDLSARRYWQLDFTPREWQFGAALEAFEETLDDAVRVRLQAETPVGLYLSGGLDSSVTTALASHHAGALQTFAATFDDLDYDESRQQAVVSAFLGTEHFPLKTDAESLAAALPATVFHAEQPLLRAGPIAMFLLSQAVTARGFGAVVTGEGADEFIGGYDIYRETAVRRFMSRRPDSPLRRQLIRRLYTYLPNRDALQKGLELAFQRGLSQADDPLFSHLQRWTTSANQLPYFTPEARACFDAETLLDEVRASLPSGFAGWHWLARAQTLEVLTFMNGYLLSSQGDRALAAHALQGRFPFLDHRVIELVNSFPPSFKLRGLRQDKAILRVLGRKLLPEAVANRPKVPYRTPAAPLFRARAFHAFADVLSAEALRSTGFFLPAAVDKLYRKVTQTDSAGEMDTMALLGIVTTQLWHRAFVQRAVTLPIG